MAFFGSKSYERELKRTYSTDRMRREHPRTESSTTSASSAGAGASRSNSITVAQMHSSHSRTHPPNSHAHGRTKRTVADEFGVISEGSGGDGKEDPPSLTFSTTSASASLFLPTEPVTPVTSPTSSVHGTRGGNGGSGNKQGASAATSRMRTASGNGNGKGDGNGSKHLSRDAASRNKRNSASSSDGREGRTVVRANSGPHSTKSKHSTSELKLGVERGNSLTIPKSRSKTSLREEATTSESAYSSGDQLNASLSSVKTPTPARPPRSARPPDIDAKANSAASSSSARLPQPSGSTSSPPLSNTGVPVRQIAYILRRDDPSLSVPVPKESPRGDKPSETSFAFAQPVPEAHEEKRPPPSSTSSSPLSNTGVPVRQTAYILRRDDPSLSVPVPKESPRGDKLSDKPSDIAFAFTESPDPEAHEERGKSLRPTPSQPKDIVIPIEREKEDDPHRDRDNSRSASHSASSSPGGAGGPTNTGLPLRQQTAYYLRRDDPALSVPVPRVSPSGGGGGGNASDSSYGTPLADFGVGVGSFSVKRLLSKPAASIVSAPTMIAGGGGGGGGVRSEPDTSTTDSYDSYNAYTLAARRRRVEGRSNAAETPSSVYSTTTSASASASVSLNITARDPGSRKVASSDPELVGGDVLGSLGRARGLEWRHLLSRDREKEKERDRERERGKAHHVREGSSFSLSSPSEGAHGPGYPYGVVMERAHAHERERERERRGGAGGGKATKPAIQLTTGAVRRLSALGARDRDSRDRTSERDRSHSPGTPMTFGPGTSPTPSPLSASSGNNANLRTGAGVGAAKVGGRPISQLSPGTGTGTSSSSSIVRRSESPMPPIGLTPAEIVAHQYKEQERRRAELEREVSGNAKVPEKLHTSTMAEEFSVGLAGPDGVVGDQDTSQSTVRVKEKEKEKNKEKNAKSYILRRASAIAAVPTPSPTSPVSNPSNADSNRSVSNEPVTPYYTVFGDEMGKVVAIGSARDSAFGLFDTKHERRAKAVITEISHTTGAAPTTAPFAAPAAPVPAADASGNGDEKTHAMRRKLSRKVSGKLRKEGPGGRGAGGKDSSGKESSDGRDDKLDLGDVLSSGGNGSDDLFATYGTEGILYARPSLTLNTTNATMTAQAAAPGRRSATLPREKNPSSHVKMSLDSFVAVDRTDTNSGQAIPSVMNGAPNSGSLWKTRSKEEKEREKEKGKLWGLMRRISSNALKDKYKPGSTEPVPPVPALPRDILPSSGSALFDDLRSETIEEGVVFESDRDRDANAIRIDTPPPRPTPLRRPSTAPTLNLGDTPKEGRFMVLRKKPSITQGIQPQTQLLGTFPTQANPQMTRSSSPMSLDMTAYSHKLSSDVSHATSHGDAAAGPANGNGKLSRDHPILGEYILPPETFSMLEFNFDDRKEEEPKGHMVKGSKDGRHDDLFFGNSEEPPYQQALPVPPRRPGTAKQETGGEEFRSESPTIPSFSSDNAINSFGARKRTRQTGDAPESTTSSAFTGGDFGTGKPSPPASLSPAPSLQGVSEPPPRPPRSARRGPPGSSIKSSNSSHSHSPSPAPSLVRAVFEDRAGRASISAHSVASTARPSVLRASSPSSTPSPPPELLDSQSPVSVSDSASSTMTFRDMSNKENARHALTEQEKVDKWNDLLDRSEKAGGTLHVGVGDALLSDQLRESTYEPTIRDSLYDYSV